MWRATLVLLLLAALSGAPSRASAGGNSLADPTVTPASGSTLATFTFSVRYDGTFPATSVTAAVAGLDLSMELADGSTTAGTWVASSTLPAGAWATIFIAYAEQGNVATVTGPALTVTPGDAVTIEPVTPETPAPSGRERHTETSREPVTETVPAATPAPAPAQPVPSTGAATPLGAPSTPDATPHAAPAIPVPVPVTTATGQPSVGGLAVPTGSATIPARSAVAPGSSSSQETSITTPTAAEDADVADATDPGQEESSIVELMGILGVGAVALMGTAMLVARRRRADRDDAPTATTAAAALQRRSVRRARLRMGEDPIMAAMGIGAEDERKVRSRPPPIDEGPS